MSTASSYRRGSSQSGSRTSSSAIAQSKRQQTNSSLEVKHANQDPKTLLRICRSKDENTGMMRFELRFVCYEKDDQSNGEEDELSAEFRTVQMTIMGLLCTLRDHARSLNGEKYGRLSEENLSHSDDEGERFDAGLDESCLSDNNYVRLLEKKENPFLSNERFVSRADSSNSSGEDYVRLIEEIRENLSQSDYGVDESVASSSRESVDSSNVAIVEPALLNDDKRLVAGADESVASSSRESVSSSELEVVEFEVLVNDGKKVYRIG